MWKDILFGGVVLIYAIRIFELICNTEENINSIKSNIILATIILLISLLRNRPIVTAFTATATDEVRKDIVNLLNTNYIIFCL